MAITSSRNGYWVGVSETLTGLTVGRSYTLSAWVDASESSGLTDIGMGANGLADSPGATTAGWQQLSVTFTAVATTQDWYFGNNSATPTSGPVYWDDVTLTADEWLDPSAGSSTVTDSVIRSQSGRIIANILTDDAVTETSTYLYDAAGRLKRAEIPHHVLTYGYAGAACGVATAGMNGNRTYYADWSMPKLRLRSRIATTTPIA